MHNGNTNVDHSRRPLYGSNLSDAFPQYLPDSNGSCYHFPRRPPSYFNDGGLQNGMPPLLGQEAASYTDPLPQALILTAIVISFGLTAFVLVLAYRTYDAHKTDDLDQLRGTSDE